MKFSFIIFSFITLNALATNSSDCRNNPTFIKDFETFLHDKRVLQKDIRESYKIFKNCSANPPIQPQCDDGLKILKKETEILRDNFHAKDPLYQECQKLLWQERTNFVQANTQLKRSSVNDLLGNCEESQSLIELCHRDKKELKTCESKNNVTGFSCENTQAKKYPEICYQETTELSLLSSLNLMCQVDQQKYESLKDCITPLYQNERKRLCNEGCSDKPKGDFCNWNDSEKAKYLGCTGYVSLDDLNKVCGSTTPPPVDPPTTTCTDRPANPLPGRIIQWGAWMQTYGNQHPVPTFPAPIYEDNAQTPVKRGHYTAIEFKTPRSGNFSGKGSWSAPNSNPVVAPLMAISKRAGDFSVSEKCRSWLSMSHAIAWSTTGDNNTCKLEPNTTYYLNLTYGSPDFSVLGDPCLCKNENCLHMNIQYNYRN